MPKLSEEDRKQREQARFEIQKTQVQAYWQGKIQSASSLVPAAEQAWEQALASKSMGMRELWLILGVFETNEKARAAGKAESCKSKWFDRIAPRVKPGFLRNGVAGFTSRTAGRATPFLELSGNGYAYVTEMGMALVQHLRAKHPELSPVNPPEFPFKGLDIEGLGVLRDPRWRYWTD